MGVEGIARLGLSIQEILVTQTLSIRTSGLPYGLRTKFRLGGTETRLYRVLGDLLRDMLQIQSRAHMIRFESRLCGGWGYQSPPKCKLRLMMPKP